MSAIRWSAVLVLGAMLGYAVALWQHGVITPGKDSALPDSSPAREAGQDDNGKVTPSSAPPGRRDAVTHVTVYNEQGDDIRHTLGVVVGKGRILVMPLSALEQAHSGVLTSGQASLPLQQVLAFDLQAGLAAVEVGGPPRALPYLASGGEHLYLGREFIALGAGERTTGWVDSPAVEGGHGNTVYRVRIREPIAWRNGALVDPKTDQLIGIAVSNGQNGIAYHAVDAGTVNTLLDRIPRTTPRHIPDFARYYAAETAPGRLAHLTHLAGKQEWARLIDFANEFIDTEQRSDQRVVALLEKAYQAWGQSLWQDDQPQAAIDLLNEAQSRLGNHPQRLLLRAAIHYTLGEQQAAVDIAQRIAVMDIPMTVTQQTNFRELVLKLAGDDGLSDAGKTSLLEAMVERFPDSPAYHRHLGRIYHARGDYAGAIDHLTRAIQLNDALEEPLRPLIISARRRLNTPGLTEAPTDSTEASIYVAAHINNHPLPFRFALDTGATYTVITAATARRLGITVGEGAPVVTLETANGRLHAPLIMLESLSVHGAEVKDVETAVIDRLGNIDGLLGLSFLKHFDVDINQSEQTLTLKRR